MIRLLHFTANHEYHNHFQITDIPNFLEKPDGFIWLDIANEPNDIIEPILNQIFHFHPLAIDDALNEIHHPKVDDWGSYLYIVLRAPIFRMGHEPTLESPELDIFLGEQYIVSYQSHPLKPVDQVWQICHKDQRYVSNGPDHILYRLADELVTDAIRITEQIDEQLDQIEHKIFTMPHPTTLEELFAIKRVVLTMRRHMAPQREVLNKLARDNYAMIDAQDRIFFRDVYDHLVRLYDISESLRDLAVGAMDSYLSVVNNRMNDIMKALTIITTLFMPLSFITGFFGMNFFAADPPFTSWTTATVFILTMLSMISLPIIMLIWVRQRKWM